MINWESSADRDGRSPRQGLRDMASYEERILQAIEDSEVGLTTVDVAKVAGVSKTTAIKYLSVLKSEGKCEFVEVGPSKLWRRRKLPGDHSEAGEGLKSLEAALRRGRAAEAPVNLSIIARLEEISEDLTVSLSFKVRPEKVEALIDLIRGDLPEKEGL